MNFQYVTVAGSQNQPLLWPDPRTKPATPEPAINASLFFNFPLDFNQLFFNKKCFKKHVYYALKIRKSIF